MQLQAYAERHHLPKELAASLTQASLVASTVICAGLATVAWLADIVPAFAHAGSMLSTTAPLMLVSWFFIFGGALAAAVLPGVLAGKRKVVKMVYQPSPQHREGGSRPDAQTSGGDAALSSVSSAAHSHISSSLTSQGRVQKAAKDAQSLLQDCHEGPEQGSSLPHSGSNTRAGNEGGGSMDKQQQAQSSSRHPSEGGSSESSGGFRSPGHRAQAFKALTCKGALSIQPGPCDGWSLCQQAVRRRSRMPVCLRTRLLLPRLPPTASSCMRCTRAVAMQGGVVRSAPQLAFRHVVRCSALKSAAGSCSKPFLAGL